MIKEAQTYAEDTGLLFMETSAKTAMNVNELFLAIGERASVFTFELKIRVFYFKIEEEPVRSQHRWFGLFVSERRMSRLFIQTSCLEFKPWLSE